MVSAQPYLFLLGGHDLEMLTIKQLLQEHRLDFVDRNLPWGAKLSHYQDLLTDVRTLVGIELTEDIAPPANYIRIDHHNELSHLSSSIEQLADLLGITLSLHQQLVAANDKGYIPAMQALGARADQIQEIRRLDRKSQGVTEQDEALAETSIQTNLSVVGGVTVVKSLTPKFSPITDRLFGLHPNRLLVYTDTVLNYYGENVQVVTAYFAEFIQQKRAYAGGGETGFFGFIGENASEVTQVKEQIIAMVAV